MKSIFLFLSLFFLFLGCLETNKEVEGCGSDEFFKKDWEYRLKTYPTFASRLNYGERHNDFFKDSPENVEKEHKKSIKTLDAAKNLLSDGLCTDFEKENLKLFIYDLESEIEGYKYKNRYIVFQPMFGPHTWMPQLYKSVPLSSLQNYKDYLERLSKTPEVFERAKVWSRLGLKEKITPPKETFKDYDSSFTDVIAKKGKDSPFFKAFEKMPDQISKLDQEKIRKEAVKVIDEVIRPSYESLYKFWSEDYYPNLRKSIAAYDLPNGADFYNYRVRHYTTLDYSSDEIHQIGLNEVSRILGEMTEIKNKVGFKKPLKDFFKHLRSDSKFYAKTKDELLKETTYILKVMDGKLPKLFNKMPRLPYGVEPIPEFIAHKSPAAYYMPGSAELSKAGMYQINLTSLESRPLYNLEALSLHEAVPGHHFQIAIAQEIENVPEFRKHLHTTAFIEGWGLYAESLGKLVGMYKDPYSDFGRLTYEQWRAMRLVVDTGIHSKNWSRDKAIEFMKENSGLSVKNIETEVDRYINWPGQALAYKMGQLKIVEFRKKAESKLKDLYDIKDFHDVILGSGAIPLKILEENVNSYIESKLSDSKKKKPKKVSF